MRFTLLLLPALSLAPLTAPLFAQEEWTSLGQNAAVHKNGNTVSLDYKVARGQIGMAMLPTPGRKLAGVTHLQFRVKTDVATMVGLMLSEQKPGGDYTALFWCPKDQWQQVDLVPADFALNDGPKDPKDPNGRLDLDQVQGIGLFDGGQFFSQMPDYEKSALAVNALTGDHKLQFEDFRFVKEGAKGQGPGIVIDDFHRSFLTWFSPGGAELLLSKSNPLKKSALEFHYQQQPYKFTAVMHSLGQVNLTGTRELVFDVASQHDAHLILTLEGQKTNGRAPRYNRDFTIAAGQTGHMTIPFSEFTLAEDSPPDPDGHLEVGHVRSIALIDVIGTLEGAKEKNTVWLADLRAK